MKRSSGVDSGVEHPISDSPFTSTSLGQSPFFLWDLLLTGFHHPPLFSIISLPPSEFYFPIHELILLMSGQCTYPGPSFSCPVCLRPYSTRNYFYQCSSCRSWVHQKCSGPINVTFHYDLWLSQIPETFPLSP